MIIQDLHCLLHADDTLTISTNRELFIIKVNLLITAITNKKMSLNLSKSGYMIINPKDDLRCDLKIESGWLTYVNCKKYLGVYNDRLWDYQKRY